MKAKAFLDDYIKIADIHADRLNAGIKEVEKLLPFSEQTFSQLTDTQIAFLDMMTTRFSRLQDIIGAKIFPLILDLLGEDALTFIDKLNKLEKLEFIHDVNWWMTLREMRNQIFHDYPDNYALLAEHFNVFIPYAIELLNFWQDLKKKSKNLK